MIVTTKYPEDIDELLSKYFGMLETLDDIYLKKKIRVTTRVFIGEKGGILEYHAEKNSNDSKRGSSGA